MKTELFAKQIRRKSLEMVNHANASHVAGALSIADVLAVLYNSIMNIDPENPLMEERDYLIYSKGHTCVALYAALALKGFYPVSDLDTYGKKGSPFISHVSSKIPGVEFSTGSLGHGLPLACGLALAFKRQKKKNNVYCVVGDGEMDEGSNWEAMLFNKLQAMGKTVDILDLENITAKFEAFGWICRRIDGHNLAEIEKSLSLFSTSSGKPFAVICDTIKGKGVSFMEGELRYHYAPPTDTQLQEALNELN